MVEFKRNKTKKKRNQLKTDFAFAYKELNNMMFNNYLMRSMLRLRNWLSAEPLSIPF